jgi:hypothetical protein
VGKTLTAVEVKKVIESRRRGRYSIGNSAYLQIAKGCSSAWAFRYRFKKAARYMRLGSVDTWSLSETRERARKLRQQLDDGIDPLGPRHRQAATSLA